MGTTVAADGCWSFAIDRGGTFTDVIATTSRGTTLSLKLPSESEAYADAAVEAMRRLMDVAPGAPFPAERVDSIRVGATVATNALLERTGAKTLFVATLGFGDALLLGDQSRPDLFALSVTRTPPLYQRVVEATERLDATGAVVRSLDREALAADLTTARAEGFDSVAIAFLHSDLNPAHEVEAGAIARATGFAYVALSHEVSPLPRYLARAETTVADAYLTPPLRAYIDAISTAVAGADLYFMTSGGGLVRGEAFRGRDAVVSGPAGGVVGVARTAEAAGASAVLGFDMGGTSTDVCRFAGALERRDSAQVAGVRLRSAMLDVETVAAGGGSILAFDGLRARVGPASAGANPGPAAYGRGGPATVTDANLVLGRLDARHFPAVFGASGEAPLDVEAARARLTELAHAMGLSGPEAAAEGFLSVAVEQTAAAIRRVSTERGFDPRDHALVAFGGAAGQAACATAEVLGMTEVLCPRYASLLSAWGIGQARMRAWRQAGLEAALTSDGLNSAARLAERLMEAAAIDLAAQGAEVGERNITLRLRYDDSDTALATPLAPLASVKAAFEAAHERLFGFSEPEREILIASVEVETLAGLVTQTESAAPAPRRSAPDVADLTLRAEDLIGPVSGPRLILRDDTQIWLAEGWTARLAGDGLVRLTRESAAKPSAADEGSDPVTLELYNRRFMGVAEAMGTALERTARSVNIKERLDFSCALFDATGDLVANAPHMPVHLGSMGASVRAVQARHPALLPGDAFALNNPYAGGTHLPDITVVMPVFAENDPAPTFFVAARGHHADVGGVQPGSMPPFSSHISEEGVLLDALPIMREGRFLEAEMLDALRAGPWPSRSPTRNVGDLKAQIAACQAGATAVTAMIEARGRAEVARYMTLVQQNAEACVRRAVRRLSNGAARIPMDCGGEIVVEIAVQPEIGEATLDFRASSAQLHSNFNAPSSIVDAAALYVFRTLVEDEIPLNAGCLRPLNILVGAGSMLSPTYPAAVVAGNVETSQHLVDALYAALGVMANAQGTMNNFTFGDSKTQYYETLCGGVGATEKAAGASAVHSHMTNSRLTDPEILERRFAVRVESFAVRRGSGGLGRWNGGDGARRRIRFLAPMEAALLSSRRIHAPQGVAGGGPGKAGRARVIRADGDETELGGCFRLQVEAGDLIEIETPGGGGFGPWTPVVTLKL